MLSTAIVGLGYWGPNLVRNFHSLKDCRVKTVCDRQEQRLSYIRSIYPDLQTTDDFDRIIQDNDIDAVVIATPISLHYEMAKKSLESGKHTFIEKPMAYSAAECSELIELAMKKNLTLMVGHTYIYSPVVRRIKKIIDHGDIGEVLYISSRRLNLGLFQNEINVAWDLAPHDLSIILYLVGGSPRTVSCHGRCHHSRCVEDITSIVLEFPRGGFAMIHSSWLDPNKVRDMTIVGSRRMILYNDLEPLEKIKIYDKRVDTPPHYDSFAEFHYSYHYGDTYSPYVKQEEPLKLEAAHFLHCIRTGAVPDTDGYNGFEVVRILEAASRSLKNGGSRMDLEPVTRKSLKVAVGATPLQQGTGSRKK